MKTVTKRMWTYEEVRKALEAVQAMEGMYHGHELPVRAIRICSANGYCVEECDKSEQPAEPKEKEDK